MNTLANTQTPLPSSAAPRYVLYSAWAVPILVLGQFALLAAIPVSLVLFGALRDKAIRPLRWWAGALAALYAAPLAYWLLRDDGAQSLSKDMHPAFAGLIVAAALVLLLKIYKSHKH